jgi:MFS family permease
MLASVLAVTSAISTLFFGALSDRIGRRPILIPAVFAFSILSWLSGNHAQLPPTLLVRALMAIFSSDSAAAALATAIRWNANPLKFSKI